MATKICRIYAACGVSQTPINKKDKKEIWIVMRINEYANLNEFIYEYETGRSIPADNLDKQKYMGIEFRYNDVYYRMCREPQDENNAVTLPDGRTGRYDVMILHCENTGYPMSESFELIGWYADLNDVLDNCIIQGRVFREVIMDDETEILGKD